MAILGAQLLLSSDSRGPSTQFLAVQHTAIPQLLTSRSIIHASRKAGLLTTATPQCDLHSSGSREEGSCVDDVGSDFCFCDL